MTDVSFFERVKILFNLIFSSPFFISLVVIFLLTTLVLILYNRIKNKNLKYVVAFGYFIIAILILIKYGSSILKLSDSLVDQIFSFLYFPNIISYICMMIVTTLLLIMTLVNKKVKPFIKTCNIITFVIIEILFVLTLDVITKNKIDIYDKVKLYSNETLMILVQASMSIFAIWLLIIFIDFIVDKINNKIDGKEKQNIEPKNEVIDEKKVEQIEEMVTLPSNIDYEEPTIISNEEFNESFKKYSNKSKYKNIFEKKKDK